MALDQRYVMQSGLTMTSPASSADKRLTVRPLPGHPSRGTLTLGSLTVPCALGKGGLTLRKREGDGATPVGRFAVLDVFYRPDRGRRPETALPVTALSPDDGWCDDPRHPRYNAPVRLPFAAGHEKMWRQDGVYDIVVVLDYNLSPAVKGKGSAIFFHLARPGYTPTEGCVAVAEPHMRRLLKALRPGAVMDIRR